MVDMQYMDDCHDGFLLKASRPIMHVPDRVEAPFHRRCASSNSAVVSNSAVSAQSLAAELSEVKSILSTRERGKCTILHI